MTRPRAAPSAIRTATSRWRSDARATSAEHRVEQAVDFRAENEARVRHHIGADTAVRCRELVRQLCADPRKLGPCLGNAYVTLQASDHLVVRTLPCFRRKRVDDERRPHGFADGKREFLRHDANHDATHAVGPDRSADEVAGTAVAVAPKFVAQEHHRFRARLVVAVAESAAEEWFDTERFECRGGELPAGKPLGTTVLVGEVHGSKTVGANLLERRLALHEDGEVVDRYRLTRLVLVGIGTHD